MMKGWTLAAMLAAMSVPGAHAADRAAPPLSFDGARGYADIQLTRVAIFDGRTDDAKKFIAEAVAAFEKAKGDSSVLAKAEADLGASTDTPSPATTSAPGSAPIHWLPVSGEFGLAEDVAADPAKAVAVAEANSKLAAGDRAGALAALKRGGARGDSVIALLPLEQTLADLRRAGALVDSGKYLEANALLLHVLGTTRLASLDDGDLAGAHPEPATSR